MSKETDKLKNELYEYLTQINFIIVRVKMQLNFAKHLLVYNNNEESTTIKQYDLSSLSICAWKCAVIDLHILFSTKKDDKYSFQKLLNKLRKTTKGEYSKLLLDQDLLVSVQRKIDSENLKIIHIYDLRDKLYAHQDINFDLNSINISFEDTDTLANIAEDIIQEIFIKIFEEHIDNSVLTEKNHKIVQDLTELRQIRVQNFINFINNEKK